MHPNFIAGLLLIGLDANASMFFIIAGLVVLTLVFVYRAERKRADAVKNFGAENGFLYEREGDPFGRTEAGGFSIFSNRRYGKFVNILRGQIAGHEAIICDFRYHQGKSRVEQTVAAIKIGGPLPPFALSSENFFTRIAGALGYSDINFEFSPEFSRRYRLCSSSQDATRALFTPDLIAVFEQVDPSKQPCVEGRGDWMAVYHPGRRLQPEQMHDFLQQTSTIVSAVERSSKLASFH